MTEHDNADEVTRLRAEVAEHLDELSARFDLICTLTNRAESAEAEVERLRRNTAGLYERTHAAEAALTSVRDVKVQTVPVHVGGGNLVRNTRVVMLDDLRAALDPASPARRPSPAPADDEGTGTGAAPSGGHSEARGEKRCSTCGSSGWYGSRNHNPEHYSPHLHCECGRDCSACAKGDGFLGVPPKDGA
jgi:hypothetical protein